jgi:phospholipase D1/2
MKAAARAILVDNAAPAARIVAPGRNCWRVDRADRFYCVQDAADYFRLVRQAMLAARHSIFVLGWDFASTIDLDPVHGSAEAPTRLDALLAFITRRRPELNCHILTWDYGALYTLEREPLTRLRLRWRTPRNLHFGFDDRHPIGASHHQKVIVIDDQLAFSGSIDLTSHRWDTTEHRVEEPCRKTSLGAAYDPYHEVQAMVSGPAAASLGVLARDRWRAVEGGHVPPVSTSAVDLWPPGIDADLVDVDVAIARTVPGTAAAPAIRECEALFLDSIAAARESIYIENQYFTDGRLAEALAKRLREPRGPEVIVVVPRECSGWVEKKSMGVFRDQALATMQAADHHQRLRLLYPIASRAKDVPTFIHSKVMTVDDRLVRIGSANFARRSMGVDTECDVAVEATDSGRECAGILRIRDRLLAEHLGVPPEDVTRGIARAGSLRKFIDGRMNADRTLMAIELTSEPAPPEAEQLRDVLDPAEPLESGLLIEHFVPPVAPGGGSPLRIWVLPGVAVALGIAFYAARQGWPELQAFQDVLTGLPETSSAVGIGIGVFILAGLLLVPVEILALVAVAAFAVPQGVVVASFGAFAVAVLGYGAGRALGPRVANWMRRRSYRSIRQLGMQTPVGVAVLHLSTTASAGAIHLLCGAARMPLGRFLLGTTMGLAPAIAALTGAGMVLRTALLEPSTGRVFAAIGAAMLVVIAAGLMRVVLLLRRFAPSISMHRERAEFG